MRLTNRYFPFSTQYISLDRFPINVEGIVYGISTGRGLTSKLTSIGITKGAKIKKINNSIGPIIIEIRGARFALGYGIIKKIFVEYPKNGR